MNAAPSSVAARLDERAHQNREIVYFLQQPETHAFDLYHDYTESRPGTSTYLNVVRAGSTVSSPRARNLDTGEDLRSETLKGEAITRAKLDVKDVTPQSLSIMPQGLLTNLEPQQAADLLEMLQSQK